MCIVAVCTSTDGSARASSHAKVCVCCSVFSCFSLATSISSMAEAKNTLGKQRNLLGCHPCESRTLFSFCHGIECQVWEKNNKCHQSTGTKLEILAGFLSPSNICRVDKLVGPSQSICACLCQIHHHGAVNNVTQ